MKSKQDILLEELKSYIDDDLIGAIYASGDEERKMVDKFFISKIAELQERLDRIEKIYIL